MEDILIKINSNKKVCLVASGRTDRGVHALGQCAHFDLNKDIDCDKLKDSINKLSTKYIYVKKIKKVNNSFHARFNVHEKKYVYKINLGEYNPIEYEYIYQYCKCLNIDNMKNASKYLIGEHDYTSFVKATDLKENNIRIIKSINFILKDNILNIEFIGNGFLRYMVRNMVGTLISVGNNEIKKADVKAILEAHDRTKALKTAPAQGLYLTEVKYN